MALHVGARLASSHAPRRRPPRSTKPLDCLTSEQLSVFYREKSKDSLPTSKVELTISCKDLMTSHIIKNKSDPYCVILMKRAWHKRYKEIGRTETIKNTQNPQWLKKLIIDYNFEIIQQIRFEVRDDGLAGSDFLGRYDTTLSELAATHGYESNGKLINEIDGVNYQECGEIIIVTEELASSKKLVEIVFRAENLPKTWFSSMKAFLLIHRSNEDSSYSAVMNTEPVHFTQNPTWQPFSIAVSALCNGDFDRCFKIDCYNYRDNGKHKLIGTSYASLNDLFAMSSYDESRNLVNEEKQKNKPNYVPTGLLKVEEIKITDETTFLDYMRGGTQLHFAVAIDFTVSNGLQTDPNSLHYLSEGKMNNYEIALQGIGEIIQHYDNSHLFPAFGFGAKLPPHGLVSFKFPLNRNPVHPYCSGVEEILRHYRDYLKVVELYGPTNFAPVINNTIALAKDYQNGKHYFVLLIITDGIISDMRLTKLAIIEASKLPISIIIVGVGNANFYAMKELDSDDVRLSVEGVRAERDIVQFVPLNNFLSLDESYIKSQADLAEEVLAEIPDQFLNYMIWRGFKATTAEPSVPDASTIQPTAPLDSD